MSGRNVYAQEVLDCGGQGCSKWEIQVLIYVWIGAMSWNKKMGQQTTAAEKCLKTPGTIVFSKCSAVTLQ